MATSSLRTVRYTNACKWSKCAVNLCRCAAAFLCAVEGISVEDLRYAYETYLRAAQIAVELAEQVRLFVTPAASQHNWPQSTAHAMLPNNAG